MGFFIKNVENVQGDERDVMIFSTTFGRDARVPSAEFRSPRASGRRTSLNVAVTRARQKIILVTSISTERRFRISLPPIGWLQAARLPSSLPGLRSQDQRWAARRGARRDVAGTGSNEAWQSIGVLEDGFAASVLQTLRELGHEPVSSGMAMHSVSTLLSATQNRAIWHCHRMRCAPARAH